MQRFKGVDPLAEDYASYSPYNYVLGNPILLTDPDGRSPAMSGPGDPPISVAGVLFEAFQNARAGLFNMEMRVVEYFGDSNTATRMRVNYNIDGTIPINNPVVVREEAKKGALAEAGDMALDALALTPIAELSSSRAMTTPFLAARTPSSIIPGIARQFDNFQCVECSGAIMKALKAEGISGEVVTLQAKGAMDTRAGNVWSDTAQKTISTNGRHQGVLVDGKVYDNIHTEGIDYNAWKKDFHSTEGIDF